MKPVISRDMSVLIRQAKRRDIADIMRIRMAVRENRLVSLVITEDDCIQAIETDGRGWVAIVGGNTVGFAIGNSHTGNIWALFIQPEFEKRGIGKRLHDTMIDWLYGTGLKKLWLTTSPNTRAQYFYEKAGWKSAGMTEAGEICYELFK